jgi:hypothetical protein
MVLLSTLLAGGLTFSLRGDSRSKGIGASEFDKTYAVVVPRENGGVYDDYSIAGITVELFEDARIPVYQPGVHGLLNICLGTNNAREKMPTADFLSLYDHKLQLALRQNWPKQRLPIESICWFDAYGAGSEALVLDYNAGLLRLAETNGLPYVDSYSIIAARPDRESLFVVESGKHIHENDLGQRARADIWATADLTPRGSVAVPFIPLTRRWTNG